jgi:hypothetical protein
MPNVTHTLPSLHYGEMKKQSPALVSSLKVHSSRMELENRSVPHPVEPFKDSAPSRTDVGY